jgi:quercetin dioxygenase-like cupin family protein
MRILLTALVLTLTMTRLAAQDPVTALPDSYSSQFENEWVKVVRVYYAPHAKLPPHAHNALPAAYVYLNDGGPVLFKHIGTSYGAATRPATKAGGFRVFRGIDEIHEVENTSDLPSEFLRIEFKTDPKDVRSLNGRFFRETVPTGQNFEEVQFENDQVRITRVIGAPGLSVRLAATPSEPSLVIALQPAKLRESGGSDITVRVGQERWIPADAEVRFENLGSGPSEFLRFDFKTAPVATSVQR